MTIYTPAVTPRSSPSSATDARMSTAAGVAERIAELRSQAQFFASRNREGDADEAARLNAEADALEHPGSAPARAVIAERASQPKPPPPRPTAPITNPQHGSLPDLYRPGLTPAQRIVELVRERQICQRKFLVSRLHDLNLKQIQNALTRLVDKGTLVNSAYGEYRLGEAAADSPRTCDSTATCAPCDAAADKPAADPPPAADAPASPAKLPPLPAAGLILSDGTRVTPRAAPLNRPLVIATLRRLSPMLAADISAVVDEAVRYIEAAA